MAAIDDLLALLGRARQPDFAPVNELKSGELIDMRQQAMDSGDAGRASRIHEVQQRRQQYGSPSGQLPPEIQQQMLTPLAPEVMPENSAGGHPLAHPLQKRKMLLDALQTQPR